MSEEQRWIVRGGSYWWYCPDCNLASSNDDKRERDREFSVHLAKCPHNKRTAQRGEGEK